MIVLFVLLLNLALYNGTNESLIQNFILIAEFLVYFC